MVFKLEDSLGFILSKVNGKMKNEFFQYLRQYDVTPEQWAVLCCLWEQDGITSKDIAEITCKDKPTTSRIIDKVLRKGLVIRRDHPEDRRAFHVCLTEKGWALKDELVPIANQLLEKATIGIDKKQMVELKKLLNKVYENVG